MLSDRKLRKAIADLKAIEKASFGSRRRFAFIAYLGAVYTFYELLRRKRVAKSSAHRIAKLFGIRIQKRTDQIRFILDATSASDSKAKSRASRALRYAWREREKWTDLGALFSRVGGVAGAAAKWSALRSRNPNGQIGLDTQGEGGGGIQVGMYSSWGENQGGGVCCDAPAAVDASGTISAGSVVPRRTGVSRGASGKIQIHATYKAEAATPRTKRSVTLRATDRGGERRVRETLGSTTAMTGSE